MYTKAILLAMIAISSMIYGQPDSTVHTIQEELIRVGVKDSPPFIYVDESGIYGPIVEFWERIDRELGYHSEYVIYEDVESLLDGVKDGEVDLSVNPITVSASRIKDVDFTQPFFITDTAILERKEGRYWTFIKGLFSWNFLSAILGLGVVILVFGFVVWMVEHRRNKDFRKGIKGIGDGFWWSAVTMTTVGYGDKAPKTPLGRSVAFVWMIVAVVGISGLTAGIASSLTRSSIENDVSSVRDLRKFRIATLEGTNASEYLDRFNVPHFAVESIDQAFEMIVQDQIDYFVFDRVLIRTALRESPLKDELHLMDRGIRTDYYSFPVNRSFSDYNKINEQLLNDMNGLDWIAIQSRYGMD